MLFINVEKESQLIIRKKKGKLLNGNAHLIEKEKNKCEKPSHFFTFIKRRISISSTTKLSISRIDRKRFEIGF